jgi:hypothetical protein
MQWPVAALLPLDSILQSTVETAMRILRDRRRGNELRAVCAILIGKFGSGASRAVFRGHWESEDSEHVRAAMVFATLFLPREERKALLMHWGGQSPVFAQMAKAVRRQLAASPEWGPA